MPGAFALPPAHPVAVPGMAVPGLFMGGAPPAGSIKSPAQLWLDTAGNPAATQYALDAGEHFEVVTKDPTTLVVTGTLILRW